MVIDPPLLTALPTESSSDHVNPPLSAISSNSPDPIPRPSLKRSRSSPTFTPSSSLNPNPFVHQPTDPVEALAFLSDPLTPISSTRPPIENPNSSLDFLHLVPRLTSQSDEDGRILIIWKDPMKVRVVHQSSQSLTCLLELPNKDPFYYTAVYASNLCANRADLWAELIYLSDFYDLQNNQCAAYPPCEYLRTRSISVKLEGPVTLNPS
ncbi:hypothetical protein DY000_02004943 [Brassica cretica]|uniref:Fibronectin type-III domain-containing protein n=1 Tax=Brassica cretica TaxID=69181 RepID=A0ABQ7C695_BRACR|nr:hypothetical protein DY000_02004943 [Brassica cretica]